jgi:hypothetical protein
VIHDRLYDYGSEYSLVAEATALHFTQRTHALVADADSKLKVNFKLIKRLIIEQRFMPNSTQTCPE